MASRPLLMSPTTRARSLEKMTGYRLDTWSVYSRASVLHQCPFMPLHVCNGGDGISCRSLRLHSMIPCD